MRWGWPFVLYVVVVVAHLVTLAIPAADPQLTKALLMPALLICVLLVASTTARVRGRRAIWGVVLLALGVVASFFGDILLGPNFLLGLACFAAAHVLYVVLFCGPTRAKPVAWWSLGYVAVLAVAIAVLWPHLGALRAALIGYGIVLVLTAMTATRVGTIAAWGGGLFLLSDLILAFRLFLPDFALAFPDPWQDLAIMATYCAGEGLIALGVLRRLDAVGAAARVR